MYSEITTKKKGMKAKKQEYPKYPIVSAYFMNLKTNKDWVAKKIAIIDIDTTKDILYFQDIVYIFVKPRNYLNFQDI